MKPPVIQPLTGIKVIDFSRVLAGPYCTMILADMGAEVIKIEQPVVGDDSRHFGPPFIKGESAYFLSINRNKKSMTLNLKTKESEEIVKRLVKDADVIIQNFRPGIMEKLGLDYDNLKGVNKNLIYLNISGYGHTGPLKNYPGYDIIVQGLSGLMDLTGVPHGEPTKIGISMPDLITGLYAALAVCFALIARKNTGRGQMIDLSMLDSQVSLLATEASNFFASGKTITRIGNRHISIAPFGTIKTKDGYINLGIGNDKMWNNFCSVIKDGRLLDEKFKTNPDRIRNIDGLYNVINSIFSEKPSEYWLSYLRKHRIPVGPINRIDEVFSLNQLKSRDMIVELEDVNLGKIKVLGNPIKLSETPSIIGKIAPSLGSHNREILLSIGYSDEEIKHLKEKNVI